MDGDKLFKYAMKGKWDKVVNAYSGHTNIREAKITNAEDTALHIAVAVGRTKIVLRLVERIGESDSKILHLKNEKGNTALHLAATIGDVEMCDCMASKDPKLVAVRNKEGETPLFLAAHHGKKAAFACLHAYVSQLTNDDINSSRRKNNGDTILHSAISGEFYVLSLQIICSYPDLVNSRNETGLTPLHILANTPNVFYGSSRLRLFGRIIYYCIYVEKLREKTFNDEAYSRRKHALKQDEATDEENPSPMSNFCQCAKLPKKEDNKDDHLVPPNYVKYVSYLFRLMIIFLSILGLGRRMDKIMERKKRYTWANQVMHKMVHEVSEYKYDNSGEQPRLRREDEETKIFETRPCSFNENEWEGRSKYEDENKWERVLISSGSKYQGEWVRVQGKRDQEEIKPQKVQQLKRDTALLIAAKNGIVEIVKTILDEFPVAFQDTNHEEKNIVLLAVENRQTQVYELLLTKKKMGETAFRQVDQDGNSALHLAAKCGEHQPWLIPGGALQMQWEYKWYKFVKHSEPLTFPVRLRYNKKGETPKEIFTNTHKDLVSNGREWLTKTSESCSVVAALIATVAFGASVSVPGGFNEANGKPNLEDNAVFNIFAISSLLALCFSITALIFFLTILTSRYQEKDFAKALPRKLLLGLTSLFTSIASILIAFCSGHSFVVKHGLRFATYPIYLATCLPMFYYALEHIPLYIDLMKTIFVKVPQRSYK